MIGAGFAGIAVAWHLLQAATLQQPVHVEVFDAHGVAAGASGAAAGLLHPYTPKGKVRLFPVLPATSCRYHQQPVSKYRCKCAS